MNRLKLLRKNKELTLRDLEGLVKIDHTTLSRLETGTIHFNQQNLTILSSFFNVSVDYLLGLSDIPKPVLPVESINEQFDDLSTDSLSDVFFALYGEVKDLTDEQIKKLTEFARFLKSQKDN